MNVALWAEIRRLAEIEKLSARVISRAFTVPGARSPKRSNWSSLPLAAFLAAAASWTRTRPRSTHCWPSIPNSRRCASTKKLLAAPMATPAA